MLAAQQAMGRSWRIGVDTDERTELVTEGVFGLVRNPVFTAMIVAVGGTRRFRQVRHCRGGASHAVILGTAPSAWNADNRHYVRY